MDKILNIYETMFVVNCERVDETVTKATVEKFTSLISSNGEIIKIENRGKRHLAYPIDDMNDGYYTIVWFRSEGSFPSELERLYNIDENVIRSIVLRLEEEPAATPVAENKPAEVTEEKEAAAEKTVAEEAAVEKVAAEEAPAEETAKEAAPAEEPAAEEAAPEAKEEAAEEAAAE